MKFEFSPNAIDKISTDAIVAFAFEGKKETYIPTPALATVDRAYRRAVSDLLKLEKFRGKSGELQVVHVSSKLSPRVIVVGLGKKQEFSGKELRQAYAKLAKVFGRKLDSITLTIGQSDFEFDAFGEAMLAAEGLLLGMYSFVRYKKQEKTKRVLETVIIAEKQTVRQKQIREGVQKAEAYAQATQLARDLVNEQPAVATPTYLAKVAKEIAAKDKNIKCTIYEREQCEKMGMEAFLGIARAADTPPKFIFLEYSPPTKSKRKLAVVGKGITFDSGGINVKPGDSMQTMKIDMSGAAAVLGMFSVISKVAPAFSVIGLIAATPNLISGKSLVPGDVVRAMNGKTIEVLNTDAEGRVTMADSLSFAVKEGATEIIDVATLTGACEVALGTDIAGLMSNNRDLVARIKEAAYEAGEDVWELPLPKEYKELNKSEVADIANIPKSRYGGAITAGLFLEEFVDGRAWGHLDIAGPAFTQKEFPLGPVGGTGYSVRLLLNLLQKNNE